MVAVAQSNRRPTSNPRSGTGAWGRRLRLAEEGTSSPRVSGRGRRRGARPLQPRIPAVLGSSATWAPSSPPGSRCAPRSGPWTSSPVAAPLRFGTGACPYSSISRLQDGHPCGRERVSGSCTLGTCSGEGQAGDGKKRTA